LIGRGTFGKVYKGLDLRNGNLLAIKEIMLPLEPEELEAVVYKVKNEINLLQNLKHRNVV